MPDAVAVAAPVRFTGLPAALGRAASLGLSRGLGVGAQMGVQIAVGAMAGPAAIGALQLHAAWGTVLGEVVAAGHPTRTLRDVAVHGAGGDARRAAGAVNSAARRILAYGVVLGLLVLLLVNVFPGIAGTLRPGGQSGLLLAVVVSAPLFALVRLLAEALKALDRATLAVSLESSSIPLLLLAICAACALTPARLSIALLLLGSVAGLIIAAVLLALRLRHSLTTLRPEWQRAGAGHPPARQVRRAGELWHFWLNGLLNIIFLQLPFLLMPWVATTAEIGVYAVAHKLINVITTLLILLAAVYGPRFATAAAAGDVGRLRRLLGETQTLSLALFAPAALGMLLFSDPLAALFSLPAGSLQALLLILAAGHLVNAGTGLAGVLLNMSGAPQLDLRILLGSCLLTAALATVLGMHSGATGIAAAVACGFTLRNGGSYLAARLHMNRLEGTQA